MTRVPTWFALRLADIGVQVRDGELSLRAGAAVLADEINADGNASHAVAAAYALKRLRPWTRTPECAGQLYLFRDLPGLGATLEVSINRFKPVAEMTADDWLRAVRQIEVKERNAIAQADRVRAAYARVRALLTDPDTTTGAVAGRIPSPLRSPGEMNMATGDDSA